MKTPLKAALVSAFVFPGVGHIMLKKYLSGCALLASFAIALYVYLNDIIDKVQQVLTQVQSGSIPLTVDAITSALATVSTGLTMQTLNNISYLLLLIWLLSIADAYRVASKLLNENAKQ
jgi:hypothetical protein